MIYFYSENRCFSEYINIPNFISISLLVLKLQAAEVEFLHKFYMFFFFKFKEKLHTVHSLDTANHQHIVSCKIVKIWKTILKMRNKNAIFFTFVSTEYFFKDNYHGAKKLQFLSGCNF